MSKTCFVIMGFQTKKIPNTNIVINLDDTYNYLIKPILIQKDLVSIYSDEIHKHCFRCDEIYTTQAINETFLSNLYLADIVVADITTLNQNAIYELGLRHDMKPKSTIIMCDRKTLQNSNFFDLTFMPQIIYDSDKQKDIDEISRVGVQLSNVIDICKNSDETYIDSPVFSMRIYDKKPFRKTSSTVQFSLKSELDEGHHLLENEEYNKAESVFHRIINEYNYISNDVICSYVLASYKKDLSIDNLKKSLDLMEKYVPLNSTTYEDALGITAAIYLKLFNLTQESKYLYNAIDYYRKGASYESSSIYCGKNYCSSLLKIYLVDSNVETIREYYYTSKHYAKIFLTQAQFVQRNIDEFHNIWLMSNESDLLLIANDVCDSPFIVSPVTKRQNTTIKEGRQDLIKDLNNVKKIIGINK